MAKLFKSLKVDPAVDARYFAAVFKASGAVEVKAFPSPEMSLEWLQKAVGGFIEIVRGVGLPEGGYLVVNEEGLFLDLPLNPVASFLYSAGNAPIVGDAVVCCDFDPRTPIFEPDCYAAPLLWMRSFLDRLGCLGFAVLIE